MSPLNEHPILALCRTLNPPARRQPLAWVLAVLLSPALGWSAESTAARKGDEPIVLQAERVQSVIDQKSWAEGLVELRQAGLLLTADALEIQHRSQLVTARGNVHLEQDGNRFDGTEAQVQLDTRQGQVLMPQYFVARTGAGGRASRIDFSGDDRLIAVRTSYSSCRADDGQEPDWVLSARKLDLDFEHNDGVATGAVLRFLGVPILAAPVISFPATSAPRSGWLPPTIDTFDNRSGWGLAVPYYWRLAPNYDLTLTPTLATRRGLGGTAEFRYLQPEDEGRIQAHALPHDQTLGRSRSSLQVEHEGKTQAGLHYKAAWQSASDNDYWKDFSGLLPSLTPRLLARDLSARQAVQVAGVQGEAYARAQGWQVLQNITDPVLSPYQRLPQLGTRWRGEVPGQLQWGLQAEYNRFTLQGQDQAAGDTRGDGHRLHALASLQQTNDHGWAWLNPKLALNTAAYDTDTPMRDGARRATRSIPTLSVDSGLRLERGSSLLGKSARQTLEPRLHYANTPWRNQTHLPNYDAAALDFNEISIYGDNAFSGADFVTDAHQVTLGATSRWFDQQRGAELLRIGMAQRLLLRDQRITADSLTADGLTAPPAAPLSRFSDILLFGSTSLVPQWRLDGTVQFNTDTSRTVRSILSARWQPGPFQTLSTTYRFARGLNEQFELGWQWPIYRGKGSASSGACKGSLYGVGRVNYSMKDSRITDAIAGLEYDAGCWIGRLVFERTSTSRAEARQHVYLQLELVGLSKLGPSPLKILKDNIPGYQLLHDDSVAPPTSTAP